MTFMMGGGRWVAHHPIKHHSALPWLFLMNFTPAFVEKSHQHTRKLGKTSIMTYLLVLETKYLTSCFTSPLAKIKANQPGTTKRTQNKKVESIILLFI